MTMEMEREVAQMCNLSDLITAEKDAEYRVIIAEKDTALAEKDTALAEKDAEIVAEIVALKAQLAAAQSHFKEQK